MEKQLMIRKMQSGWTVLRPSPWLLGAYAPVAVLPSFQNAITYADRRLTSEATA